MSFPYGFTPADQLNEQVVPAASNSWAIVVFDKNGSPVDELVRLDKIGFPLVKQVESGNFTAVAGNAYHVDTTGGAIQADLPASPADGDIIAFVDYAGTATGGTGFDANNLTVDGNGKTIAGSAQRVLSNDNQSLWVQFCTAEDDWNILVGAGGGGLDLPISLVDNAFVSTPNTAHYVDAGAGSPSTTTPATPVDGDFLVYADYTYAFSTDPLVITAAGGQTFDAGVTTLTMDNDGEAVLLQYEGSTMIWKKLSWAFTDIRVPLIDVDGAFTTREGNIHYINSVAGVSSTTLPSGPPKDTVVAFKDAGGAMALNNLTIVAGGGDTIEGGPSYILDVDDQALWFQYNTSDNDWKIIVGTGGGSGASFLASRESGAFLAVPGTVHHVDTSGGLINAILPAGAADGTIILFADAAGSDPTSPSGFGNFPLVINPDAADTIQGYSSITLDVENEFIGLQYLAVDNRWNVAFGLTSGTVLGSGGSSGDPGFTTENGETLAADKVLLETDAEYQFLDPGGSNRNVDLPTTPSYARRFIIIHDGGADSLDIRISAVVQDTITTGQQSAWVYSTSLAAWRQI